MAKTKNENVEEPKAAKQYKGIAKVQIKYAGEYIKAGEKFDIAEKDVEELNKYADVEEIEVEKGEDQKEGE